MQLERIKLS